MTVPVWIESSDSICDLCSRRQTRSTLDETDTESLEDEERGEVIFLSTVSFIEDLESQCEEKVESLKVIDVFDRF